MPAPVVPQCMPALVVPQNTFRLYPLPFFRHVELEEALQRCISQMESHSNKHEAYRQPYPTQGMPLVHSEHGPDPVRA